MGGVRADGRLACPDGGAVSFRPEALTPELRRALRDLAPAATDRGFYLAGGTAVAIHLGHRRSNDLDWFSPDFPADPLDLARELREDAGLDLEVEAVEPGTLHASLAGVRVSFLEYRYPVLLPLVAWPAFGVRLASLDDLATMKLAAVAQRGDRKDFVDVYALAREHRPLGKLVALYRKRYEVRDVGHLLYALAYFDDAEREPMPVMLWDVDWPEVRAALEGWVSDLA